MSYKDIPELGFGLGLRVQHYPHIFEHWPQVDWFEIISENFMDTDGRPRRNLEKLRTHYPIAMHGVSLSIGTVDPLNSEYMLKLKNLIDWLEPAWVSDHLCWTGVAHGNSHDLLPVPYTEEALHHIVERIDAVQNYLKRPIALENPSTYLEFIGSTMPEADFIAQMAKRSGCNLLLDVNNVYVTCYNHRLDPKTYLDALPLDQVVQIHLSGHTNNGTHIVDTHDDHVIDPVWDIYRYVVQKAGRIPNSMVEWDDNIPEFEIVYQELEKAKRAAADSTTPIQLPDLAQERPVTQMDDSYSLEAMQQRFQQSIIPGEGEKIDPANWISAKHQFSPEEQLCVYENAYRYRLYNVTAEEYPVLNYYLGDEVFSELIEAFVIQTRSEHFNIGRYPLRLPEFLAAYGLEDPCAQEICELERTISQLADLEETVVLEAAHLEGMTPEDLMESELYPRAALTLMALHYPLNEFYRQVKEEEAPKAPDMEENYLVVFRHQDAVWRMDLECHEYALLAKLFSGMAVGAALESLMEELPSAEAEQLPAQLSVWFARWIQNGLLAYRT